MTPTKGMTTERKGNDNGEDGKRTMERNTKKDNREDRKG